jgi:phosphoribosylanthranilate isomerase
MIVKICGMTNLEDAQVACEMGADAIGFIFYPKSPRYIEPEIAALISGQLPPQVLRVAVTVNMSLGEVQAVEAIFRPNWWQLHGEEGIAHCRAMEPRELIKVFGMPMNPDLPPAQDYPVHGFLLDKASPAYGGTGETIDWKAAAEFKKAQKLPVFLSGGLSVDNIRQAIEVVEPYGVDVCSGVEASPGKKDHRKMKEFIERCKNH